MRVNIETRDYDPMEPPRVGNVYSIRGGRGLREGHMMILIAITPPKEFYGRSVLMLVVDREGVPVGVTSYGLHYLEDKAPIAFVDGLEDLNLTMRSI